MGKPVYPSAYVEQFMHPSTYQWFTVSAIFALLASFIFADKPHEVRVTIKDEAVVAMAPYAGNGWGKYQFPLVAKGDDGHIYASFSIVPDSVLSDHGKDPVYRYDTAANSWVKVAHPQDFLFTAVTLSNGDKLVNQNVHGPAAKTLALPAKCSVAKTWRNIIHYDARDIAPIHKQWWFFARQQKGAEQWVDEAPTFTIPGETLCVREGLLMNSYFLQMLLAPPPAGAPATGATLFGVNMNRRFVDADCTKLQAYNPIEIYASTDNGHAWTLAGEIPFQPDITADPLWKQKMGFCEPWLDVLPDDSLLCVIRSMFSTPGPLYFTRSVDRGHTWSTPVAFSDDHGVKPKLLTLKNGVTVVSYGRPDVCIAVTNDPTGLTWQAPIRILPPGKDTLSDTCGYTHLVALGDHEFMLIYSDFTRLNAKGERCKTIVTKRISVK